MYLKSLTALGFKSFADKTTLNFMPGVSAIVGPNGCGKSNISDAIRWVLGEQSAKALRGGEMADVIFNGTDHRKALGMAEVSLTIGDIEADHLKAAGVELAYNEVTVTRRVFRDGGSEYFINKTPCRLKDIQQLFMGTGVGRSSYSIMAQGNITQIISSKPEDRRMVFEEAAGITKFKAQKKEALRKLEHTEQNLLRVADLIREVKRQIGSLQRQAGKARKYKQLMVELQHLDTQLARHHYDVLKGEIAQREASIENLRGEIEKFSNSVLVTENEVAQLRQQLAEIEEQSHRLQQQALELKNLIERHESRIQFNQERLHELETQNAKALSDITQGEERIKAAELELQEICERLDRSNRALDEHRLALESRKEAVQSVEREMIAKQEALRKAQTEAFAAMQQLTRARNELNALDLQKQGNIVRLEKLSAEKIQLEEERTRLESRIQEFAANVELEKANVQTSRGTVEERQARLRELDQQIQQATGALDGLLRQQAEKRSRLNLLEQLQTEYEGFGSGAVAALKGAQDVVGSLTDHIKAPNEYITAVEAALGQNLQLVLTELPDSAVRILTELAQNKRGRANIAALSMSRSSAAPPAERPPLPDGCVRALDVVQFDAAIQPLIERLLGRTLIVPALPEAAQRWLELGGGYDLVTTQGEILSRDGVFTGGAANGSNGSKANSSVLSRKNQIEALQAELAALQEKINESSKTKGALQSEQTALNASLQEAQSDLRTQEVAIATRQGEFNALQSSLRGLHQKIDTVVYEIQSLAAQEKEGESKRSGLVAQASQLELREKDLQQLLAGLNNDLDQLRQQRETAQAALTETKVALASEEQVGASFKQQRQALEHRLQELKHLLEQRRGEVSSFVNRRAQYETESQESRHKIISLQTEREQINLQLTELAGERDNQETAIQQREEQLRDHRRHLTELQHQRGSLDVELAQKNMSVDNLRQRILEKYQLRIEDIRSECITITIADEGPPKVQTLTPEEMAAQGAATDWNAVSEQVASLQERIDAMGPVNLVAIEEYEETEQRFQFLSTQHDDLVKAKEQLLDVINKINVQTKEMFADTFNKIRDNFRLMFTEIFGGGKADLVLVNEGDVLESGIDIVARPPGKQLQSISLLSGGEQTMTAVALLFSIYQVKPSPFCVLDELDAPLDESNINRFIKILKRFLEHSQFVIITHNKRTIGMADVLYGVTMEEHGVSKIVSVKFHKANEAVENPTQKAAEPQPAATEAENATEPAEEKQPALEVAIAE